MNKNFYNIFHKKNKVQRTIIKKNNFTYKLLIDVLDKFIQPQRENINILDIGCGTGAISLYLATMCHKILAIDISNIAIETAKKSSLANKISNIKFQQVNFPNKYPTGKYNYITCFEVLEHIKNDAYAMTIIYKLLAKNGLAFISVPSRNAPLFKLGLTKDFDRKVGHLRRYTRAQLSILCKQAGFTIVEARLSEGIIRNSLYLLSPFSLLLRFIKFFIVDFITMIDTFSLKLFGESQIIVVVKK